jgi:hypothetical protein
LTSCTAIEPVMPKRQVSECNASVLISMMLLTSVMSVHIPLFCEDRPVKEDSRRPSCLKMYRAWSVTKLIQIKLRIGNFARRRGVSPANSAVLALVGPVFAFARSARMPLIWLSSRDVRSALSARCCNCGTIYGGWYSWVGTENTPTKH